MSLRGTRSSAVGADGGSSQLEKHTKHIFLYGSAPSASTNGRKVVSIQSPRSQQQLHSRRKLSDKTWKEGEDDDDDFTPPPTATTANNNNEKKTPENSEKNDVETPVTVDNTQGKLDISNENVPEGITATKEVEGGTNNVDFGTKKQQEKLENASKKTKGGGTASGEETRATSLDVVQDEEGEVTDPLSSASSVSQQQSMLDLSNFTAVWGEDEKNEGDEAIIEAKTQTVQQETEEKDANEDEEEEAIEAIEEEITEIKETLEKLTNVDNIKEEKEELVKELEGKLKVDEEKEIQLLKMDKMKKKKKTKIEEEEEEEEPNKEELEEVGDEEKNTVKSEGGTGGIENGMEEETEKLTFKEPDEDDALIEEEEKKEVVVAPPTKDGMKDESEESVELTEEAEPASAENDEQEILEKETENKLEETPLEESTGNNDTVEIKDEEEIATPTEVVTKTKVGLSKCQDDPTFQYKGYEGFNCEYIKENKPEKCNKMHDGEKVGVVSCPVSCDMVNECMALLTTTEPSDVVQDANDEATGTESEDEPPVAATKDELVVEEKVEQQVEKEMDSKLENDTEEGTVDEDTAEKLEVETEEATKEGVFEKELEKEMDESTGGTTSEQVGDEADDPLITIGLSHNEEASMIELDDPPVVANLNISADDLSFCQDDPEFKFKGLEGFNCEYIKENKPEKCNKVHNGEKVGVVYCPVSCDLVDECKALQKSKVDAALANASLEEDSVVTEKTAEESTESEVSEELLNEQESTMDAEDGEEKSPEVTEEEDKVADESEITEETNGDEESLAASVEETSAAEVEVEAVEEEISAGANDKTEENEISAVVDSQIDQQSEEATTMVPTQVVEKEEEEVIDDQQLEKEIEAKLEKALEEGELDEEEVEELEYEMEEALEEGAGDLFEAELDKELRCKDDPNFLYFVDDLERDCLWIRQNERCQHVHEDSGKVIGKFFCPETCGMKEECEKLTAADNTGTMQMPQVEDKISQWDNNMGGSNSQEYYQEPNSYSQPTNGIDNNWQGYGGENQQKGNVDNNPSVDYDENWLDDDGGFPFGIMILLFLGVGFFIFRKSQSSSTRRQQDMSRGSYQRVGHRVDLQEHSKRY